MNMDVPVNGPPLQQQDNGGLQFDEDLRDIPQQLEAARPPPPPQPQPNLPAQFPSVLAAPAHPHTTLGPAPGIPVNRAPEQLPALTPLNPDGTPAPPKRPRGRPRKIPGTESRGGTGTPGQPAAPRPRGRPKGSRGRGRGRGRGGRGRGGKRARMSSDEDDFEGDGSETEEEERRSRRGGRGGGADEDDDEDDDERVVDLNREVDDDFGEGGRLAATTKFGRKISKPKSFVPTNRPTIHRKKRQATAAAMLPAAVLDANLMCEVCRGGHSPDNNKLVICDACTRGWHQLCHTPTIQPEVVDSPASWFCAECDAKLAAQRKVEDVTEEERGWTDGRGEEKVVEGAAEVGDGEKKEGEGDVQNLEVGENGELVVVKEEKEKVPDTNLGKEEEYGEKVKREWLESLPVKTLVGYVLSVEKKFAPLVSPGSSSLPIWPPALPSLLHEAAVARQQEAADRERKLELEAEELAAAQNILLSGSNMGTPLAGGAESQPASEVGTPLGYEQFTTQEPVGARTAASRRAELQAAAAAEQQQQQQPVASTSSSSGASPYTSQQGYPVASTSTSSSNGFQPQQPQQQQHHIPPFHRPALTPVSALQAAAAAGGPSSSLSSVSPAGSPAPMADIPVGVASSSSVGGGGARATYSAYPPGYSAPAVAAAANSHSYTAAAAMAAMGYPGAQYANQFATGIGAGPGVGVGGTPEWAQQGGQGAGMQRGGSGQGQ